MLDDDEAGRGTAEEIVRRLAQTLWKPIALRGFGEEHRLGHLLTELSASIFRARKSVWRLSRIEELKHARSLLSILLSQPQRGDTLLGMKMSTTLTTAWIRALLVLCACLSLSGSALGATYWVSPTGAAAWGSCSGSTPLSGSAACALGTANTNAAAGDTVYLRGGTYTISGSNVSALAPANSGTCASSCPGAVGASRIIFSAYTGETPILQQSGSSNYDQGITLNGVNWIKITGIQFQDFGDSPLFLENGASYNEISYSQFTSQYTNGNRSMIGAYATPWSTHNWVHHNYFSNARDPDPCVEGIDTLRIGNAEFSPAYSADDYNTVEFNYFEKASHATLVTYGKHNVVRNNISHNEPFKAGCTSWQTSTSTSSVTIGTGSQTFATQTGLAYTVGGGQVITILASADYTKVMWGVTTSYNSSTGSLVVNVMRTGGTGTVASWILSQGNVPYYVNSSYNGMYAHRNFGIGDEDLGNPNLNLIEGNRLGFGSTNPNNGGASNLDLESPQNIARYNFLYAGMSSGMVFKSAYGAMQSGGVSNHVYNNTIYSNGTGWNPWLYGGENMAYNGQGIGQYTISGNTKNAIKNNLLYGNRQGDICDFGWPNNNTCTADTTIDTVVNNWVTTNGDPTFANPALTDPTSQNLLPTVHGYTTTPIPNLTLQSSSPAIDGGSYLTQAVGSGAGSTSLTVADTGYFQDGTWGSDLVRGVTFFPDTIAIGTVGNTVQISSVTYCTWTVGSGCSSTQAVITLASPMTWSNNASIWLYKKSDGAVVLAGAGPDFGASEYLGSGTRPLPPTNLQSIVR